MNHIMSVVNRAAILAIAVSISLASCTDGDDGTDGRNGVDGGSGVDSTISHDTSSNRADSASGDTRPASIVDTMRVEGEPQRARMELIATDLYSTYYPVEDLIADQTSSGEGTGVTFTANFGGRRNDSAFLHIFHPGDERASIEALRELLLDSNGIIASRGWRATIEATPRYAWARETYSVRGDGNVIGFATITQHRDRAILITAAYPAEYGDGMGARIARILHYFRWSDGGSSLERSNNG